MTLFEGFIEADASWFERADDSDGSIGDAVRAACWHWLKAAALCETPAQVWPERLMKLAEADEYGAREELLRRADLLLGEPALRELVVLYESRMVELLPSASEAQRLSHEVFKMPSALSLLSEALHDPDVKSRAVLMYSPQPNAIQREAFVRAHLDSDRPVDALAWLERSWDYRELSRQSLLAEALGRHGRFEESAPIRQLMFERSLAVFYFQQWLERIRSAAVRRCGSGSCQVRAARAWAWRCGPTAVVCWARPRPRTPRTSRRAVSTATAVPIRPLVRMASSRPTSTAAPRSARRR